MSTNLTAKIKLCKMPFEKGSNFSLDSFNAHALTIGTDYTDWLNMAGTPEMSLNLLVTLPFPDSDAFSKPMKYNYAIIRMQIGTFFPFDYYYFIEDIFRKGNGTIAAQLRMDTLNSYSWQPLLSSKTLILRQHKDRFIKEYGGSFYVPIVDKVSEGLPAMPKRKTTDEYKFRYDVAGISGKKWYLIYRSAEVASDYTSGNAITCSAICQDALKISNATSSGSGSSVTINASDLAIGSFYYLTETDSPGFSVFAPVDGGRTFSNGSGYPRTYMIIFWTEDGTTIKISVVEGRPREVTTVTTYVTDALGGNFISFLTATYARVLSSRTTEYDDIIAGSATYVINAGTTSVSAIYSKSFANLDRTDSKIVKIVELPYPPAEVTLSGGLYSLAGFTFSGESNEFVLDDITSMLGCDISLPLQSGLHPDTFPSLPALGSARSLSDPKTWHSDFTTLSVRYDSFSYQIKHEDYLIPTAYALSDNPYKLESEFHASNDISSSFLFRIKPINAYTDYYDEMTYPGYLLTGRNNEVTIFSNAYINYMRTGYNYDQKVKNLQVMSSAVSVAGGVATGVVGGLMATSGNPAGAIVGAVMGGVMSAINAAISAESRETQFQENLAKLQAQAANISGAGDLSLFNVYGGQLDIGTFRVSDAVLSKLEDLFYYFGYACNQLGIPNVTSRHYFNFVQAEVVYKAVSSIAVPKFALDDIRDRIREGVTVFHYHSGYHLEQTYENLETSLL